MNTQKHKSEAKPEEHNQDEVHFTEPGKAIKAQNKIDIKESELGREQGQMPADEHIENQLSQIDEGTKAIQVKGIQNADQHHDATEQNVGYMNDETSADRDTGNSHKEGWENSRTSRHK